MNRDHFIISVYCLTCQKYRAIQSQQRIRRAGFAPQFTDAEALTVEMCGGVFALGTDEAISDYFKQHYGHFFRTCRNAVNLCARWPTYGWSKR